MQHPVVVGLQYGDEGKGKITDVLAKQADWVIRFNGGNNAGHTLWLNGKKLVTHSVPSGVRSSHSKNFIGAGCVIDPKALKIELDELNAAGADLSPERLKIDFRAHITLPVHLALDAAREGGPQGIGSTKRGIGPTYTTKMDRLGVRVEDVATGQAAARIKILCDNYNPILKSLGLPESKVDDNVASAELAQDLLRRHISRDPTPFFEIAKNQRCVLEGAQGVHLDLDHGTFPYVTSSNTLAAFAAVGTPFPVRRLGSVIGVAKAYLTRVGLGPFDTELKDETGHRLREKGAEYGATTGRPRRIGWINLDELKLACRLTDCTHIVLTKSDVLMGEAKVGLYAGGKLEWFEGWSSMTDKNFTNFVERIEEFVEVPVAACGTGPDRADILFRQESWDFWAKV